jgi:Cys-tRNA(Pro)/Cys-tRNA(Cys) deacylase
MGELHFRVHRHLESARVPYVIRDHEAATVPIDSPADFAAALGYSVGRIMKTLVCQTRSSERLVAVVCPVDLRVDFKRIARELDCGRLEVAKSEQLETVIGYPRLGVSPFGLGDEVTIALASQAMDHKTVLVGGGEVGVEVEIAPHDLQSSTDAVLIDLTPID